MKKNKLKAFYVILILVVLGVAYYLYLDSRPKKEVEIEENAEVVRLINKNIDEKYPETPREIVRLYNRIMICYYNEEYTNNQLISLTKQARKLYDEELLEKNPYDEYFERLNEEIEEYKKSNRIISSCLLEGNRDVEYYTLDKRKYSEVNCVYYLKGDEGTTKVSEEYVLRKDDDGKWKILYWKLADKEDEE
ncbi:MAG: hypothetical protein E7270_11115 [Lachnospiraceae bacterium]|nr:hypothetical protein [Lachnospiraceae bacterium]MBQ4068600.1 hypothetical protein [Lachnospiraceae bacterium]